MQEGWIKLYRSLLESSLFEHPELLKFWVWCLLKANHEEKNIRVGIQEVSVKSGAFIFGRKRAANELNITETTAYKHLKRLEKEQRITIKSNNKFSVVTLKNWEDYQQVEEKRNNKGTTKEQQKNNKRITREQQEDNKETTKEQQRNTNKNIKNEKNVKNEKNEKNIIKHTYPKAFEEFWGAYPRKDEKAGAYKKYQARLQDGFSEVQLLIAAKQYAEECKQEKREKRYTKQAKTFLSESTPFLDYLNRLEQTERSKEHDISGSYESNRPNLIQEAMEAGINPDDFTGF